MLIGIVDRWVAAATIASSRARCCSPILTDTCDMWIVCTSPTASAMLTVQGACSSSASDAAAQSEQTVWQACRSGRQQMLQPCARRAASIRALTISCTRSPASALRSVRGEKYPEAQSTRSRWAEMRYVLSFVMENKYAPKTPATGSRTACTFVSGDPAWCSPGALSRTSAAASCSIGPGVTSGASGAGRPGSAWSLYSQLEELDARWSDEARATADPDLLFLAPFLRVATLAWWSGTRTRFGAVSVQQINNARLVALTFIRDHAGRQRTDLEAALWAELPVRPQLRWCPSAWDEELIAQGLLVVAQGALKRRVENDGEFRDLTEREIGDRLAYFLNQVVPRCPRDGSVEDLAQRIASVLEPDGRRSRNAASIARAAGEAVGADSDEVKKLFERVRKQISRRNEARNDQEADDARIAEHMRHVEGGFRMFPTILENLVEIARNEPHDPSNPHETARIADMFARNLCSGLLPADFQRVKSRIAAALRPRPGTPERLVRVALTAAGISSEFFKQVRTSDGELVFA